MPGPKSKPEVAALGAVHKTIPTTRATASVSTSSATLDLTPYAGKWIWLRAITADVTILLAGSVSAAGSGYVLTTAAGHVDFYVDPDDSLTMAHIAGSAATLEILS